MAKNIVTCSKEERHIKSNLSVLAENCCQFLTKHFSPYPAVYNPGPLKGKGAKSTQEFYNPSKATGKCEFKFLYKPFTQLFKADNNYNNNNAGNNDPKSAKKLESLPHYNTNKRVYFCSRTKNKVFRHNATGTESLRSYREINIYSRAGKIPRKQLEKAIEMFNTLKDEAELAKKNTVVRRSLFKKEKESLAESKSLHRHVPHPGRLANSISYSKSSKDVLSESKKTNSRVHSHESAEIKSIRSISKHSLLVEKVRLKKGSAIKKFHNSEKPFVKVISEKPKSKETVMKRKEGLKDIKELEEEEEEEIKVSSRKIISKILKRQVEKKLPKLDYVQRKGHKKIKEKIPLPISVLNISLPPISNQDFQEQKNNTISNRIHFRDLLTPEYHITVQPTYENQYSLPQFALIGKSNQLNTVIESTHNIGIHSENQKVLNNERENKNDKYWKNYRKENEEKPPVESIGVGPLSNELIYSSNFNKFDHMKSNKLHGLLDYYTPRSYYTTKKNDFLVNSLSTNYWQTRNENNLFKINNLNIGQSNTRVTTVRNNFDNTFLQNGIKIKAIPDQKVKGDKKVTKTEYLLEKSFQTLKNHDKYMQRCKDEQEDSSLKNFTR